MNSLKVFLIVWTCTIAFDTSVTAAEEGDTNVLDTKQKFCGELLDRTIEKHCVDKPRMLVFQPSKTQQRNQTNTIVGRFKIRGEKHGFLQRQCCEKECSEHFIKSNCPGTRKGDKVKRIEIIGHQPTTSKTMTTARPRHKWRFIRRNRTTTTSRPTTTTTTTTVRPTTTSRTTTEYDDLLYFILTSS
ncbi:integumentary mucin C.1-like [Myzus persicae]|uniref:integumentary mucin C.1-like n=1 Tax=Myzus persicae TaxID=13164 RepID=UPI000B92F99A|nr:integumentary mucin C.1-like [Myzus persicae]